jgi:hypothetical protein
VRLALAAASVAIASARRGVLQVLDTDHVQQRTVVNSIDDSRGGIRLHADIYEAARYDDLNRTSNIVRLSVREVDAQRSKRLLADERD